MNSIDDSDLLRQPFCSFPSQDLAEVNPHFGTAADLVDLVNAVHNRGMLIMVGVVANHVGPVGHNYTSIVQFNDESYYHDCRGCPSSCNIQDWQNQPEVEHCRLSGLPDLNQTNSFVSSTLKTWVRTMIDKFKIDGIRVDTVPEVPKSFWSDFVQAAGVFQIGEVFDGRVSYVASYQPPLTSLLSYPMYFTLKNVFAYKQSMYQLRDRLSEYAAQFRSVGLLGGFLDNHDNARFLSIQSDYALYKAGLIFNAYSSGIPIVYYGTEQGFAGGDDPRNREPLWVSGFNTRAPLYTFLQSINTWRKRYNVFSSAQTERYADDQFYAFTRGQVFIALTNVGSTSSINLQRQITYHSYAVGTTLCNLFYPTDCVPVTPSGFTVVLNNGESKIFVPQGLL